MARKAENILISLHPRHAENILTGTKTVELRRRTVNVAVGSRMWLYSKVPEARIVGLATIMEIHFAPPKQIWRRYKAETALTSEEFHDYFADSTGACAISLSGALRLQKELSLTMLRKKISGFHPPQFFTRLDPHGSLLSHLEDALKI